MNDDEDPDEALQAARVRLAELRQQHQDLDDSISALEARPRPDMIQIARLKKRKLALRDEITGIEDDLFPDIIA